MYKYLLLAMANYTNRQSFPIQFSLVQTELPYRLQWILINLNVNGFFLRVLHEASCGKQKLLFVFLLLLSTVPLSCSV